MGSMCSTDFSLVGIIFWQWEDQHVDLSCEEFRDWKIANDPEQQLIGLSRHLEENGIGLWPFIGFLSPHNTSISLLIYDL